MIVRCCVMLLVCLIAACAKPATVAFEPPKPVVIESAGGTPAPRAVVRDANGNELPDVRPVMAVDAADVVQFDPATEKLLPQKNGAAKLTATVEGLPPAALAIKVLIVDELSVRCAAPCAVRVGETLKFGVTAVGAGGAPLDAEITWTSDAAAVASVAGAEVRGVAPGEATITAALGKRNASVRVTVKAPIDEVGVVCPTPPRVVVQAKTGDSLPAPADFACELVDGEDVKLPSFARGAGKLIMSERIDWKSSDASAVVVGGVATGKRPGVAVLEARVGDIAAELPVAVYAPGKRPRPAACRVAPEARAVELTAGAQLQSTRAAAVLSARVLCETTAAKRCLDDGVDAIKRALAMTALDDETMLSIGKALTADRASRCCCSPAP
jgi:hypothetical protein